MYSKLDRAIAPASTRDGPQPIAWSPAGAGSGSCARAHPGPAPFRPIASRRSRIGSRSVGRPGCSRGLRHHAPMPAAALPVSVGRSGWRPTETGPERSRRSSRTRHPGRGPARSNERTVRERGFGSSSLDPSVRSSAPAPLRSVGNAPTPRAFPRLAATPRHRSLKRRSGSCERLCATFPACRRRVTILRAGHPHGRDLRVWDLAPTDPPRRMRKGRASRLVKHRCTRAGIARWPPNAATFTRRPDRSLIYLALGTDRGYLSIQQF